LLYLGSINCFTSHEWTFHTNLSVAAPPGCDTSRTSSQLTVASNTNTNGTIHVNDFGYPTSSLLHAVPDLTFTVEAAATRAFVSLIFANAHPPLQTH